MATHASALAFLRHLEMHGIKLGLENIRSLVAALGHPEASLRSVIVGGTNGKGSTAAMLASIAKAAGIRAGLYTSPHLVDPRERIVVDGQPLSKAAFGRALGVVREAAGSALAAGSMSRPPTYFEAFTAGALAHFRTERVELAILEVGMGGRFDATNVVTPLVSVITNVGLDHTQYLGSTLREIATEKAGIIKPRVPVVTLARGRALGVIRGRARQLGAPLHGAEVRLRIASLGPPTVVDLETPVRAYPGLRLGLPGRHQAWNAAAAVLAAELLVEAGLTVGEDAIRTGIAEARWSGRLDPRPGVPPVLYDVAHNPDGARAIRAYVEKTGDPRRTVMLTGLTQGRDPKAMALHLAPLAREVVVTAPPGKAAVDPQRLAAAFRHAGRRAVVHEHWREALATARARCGKRDLLLVTGSVYLVGAIMGELGHAP